MRRAVIVAAAGVALGCGGSPVSPSASSASSAATSTSPPGGAPSTTTPMMPATFSIVLPVAAGDTAADAFGLNPFGIHFGGTGPGGHGLDGHPGWDVEYRQGAQVRAAADGVVQSVVADPQAPDRVTVQIHHQTAAGSYRTVYTNVTTLAGGVAANAAIGRGQPIGTAGSQTQFIGTRLRTWAMTHFQVDDFSRNEGSTNPNAVNPEPFLTAAGRDLFDSVWGTAAWDAELTEPFTGNPRDVGFPLRRTWTRESGAQLPVRLDFIRGSAASSAHTYALFNMSGVQVEQGSVAFTPASGLSAIELRADSGLVRAGVVDIVGDRMRINVSAPGAPRETSLDGALVYRTVR